jgi:hypothetical protein
VLTREVGSDQVERRLGRPTIGTGGTHCYVPGLSLHDYRQYGAGQLVPGGANMVFNLHYQTTGTAAVDQMRIGFTLAKGPPAKKIVQLPPTVALPGFAIPPHEPDYVAPPLEVEIRQPAELVWMSPHMHFRGKEMRWTMTHPDGRQEILLSVPRYTYNWQLQYQTRVPVPAGSRIRVDARYDNSSANRANPNPDTWVYPGNQAWEEMMVGFTWLVVDTAVDERELAGRWTRAGGD